VTKRIAAHDYRNLLESFAAQREIIAEARQQVSAGWAVRVTNPIVASEFRHHFDPNRCELGRLVAENRRLGGVEVLIESRDQTVVVQRDDHARVRSQRSAGRGAGKD
jgi:hypothetical protein